MLRAVTTIFLGFVLCGLPCTTWAAQDERATHAAPAVNPLPPLSSTLPESLVGHWFNTQNNATVGLIIQADKTCELYTERLTAARSGRPCKIEFYRDTTYWIYLKGASGQCGESADFEFHYLQSQQRVELDTGGGVNFLLEKRLESQLPSNTSKKST